MLSVSAHRALVQMVIANTKTRQIRWTIMCMLSFVVNNEAAKMDGLKT